MKQTHQNSGAEEEIRQLDNESREAMLRSDVAALECLCSEDFVVTSPLYRIANKRQFLDGVQSGRIRYTALEKQIEYLRIYGESAVVMGNETVVETGPTIHRRYTEVWMRQGGRWQLIARHANNIVQA